MSGRLHGSGLPRFTVLCTKTLNKSSALYLNAVKIQDDAYPPP